MLFIGTVLAVLFVIQEIRGAEAGYLFENLDVGRFPLSGIYSVGYAWSNKGPIKLKGKMLADLKSQAAVLYPSQYFLLAGLLDSIRGLVVFAGVLLTVVAIGFFLTQFKQIISERTAKCEAVLPEVVSTMAILVNSGMVLKDAWKLVADNGQGEFYELMKRASEDMNNGFSDSDAIYRFGKASNSGEIKKFVSALLQSMEKGGAELTSFLANQSSELWKLKRQHMLQEGEKAATKLLAPIVLIFIGVMIIVITAAFAGGLF